MKKKQIYKNSISNRKPPVNLAPADYWLFQDELQKLIPKTYIQFNKNLYIKNLNLYIFNKFQICYKHTKMKDYNLSKKIKLFLDDFFTLKKSGEIIYLERGMWVLDEKSFHYFHWFCDTLPRFIQARSYNGEYPLIIPKTFIERDYIKQSLINLNISYFIYDENITLKVKELLISSHVSPSGNYNKININNLSKSLRSNKNKNINKNRLWISREHSKHRKIKNQKFLKKVLKKYNFQIIYPEKISFTEQIEIFSNAEVIAGLHGGGLTNMVFMEPHTKVFEIRREGDNKNNCYFSLASDLDMDYSYLNCSSIGKDLYVSDVEVDLSKLDLALSELL